MSTSPTIQALYDAGIAFPGVRCLSGTQDPMIQQLATDAAQLQALRERCGHWDFDARFMQIQQDLSMLASEIAAMSWPEQKDLVMRALGDEMWKCWRESPGHWAIASKPHARYGLDMVQAKNGIWFATVLVADPE